MADDLPIGGAENGQIGSQEIKGGIAFIAPGDAPVIVHGPIIGSKPQTKSTSPERKLFSLPLPHLMEERS